MNNVEVTKQPEMTFNLAVHEDDVIGAARLKIMAPPNR
jgi:hypothetical protein